MIDKKVLGKIGDIEIGLADSTLAGQYTQEELDEGFRWVENKDHWKGPIDAIIPSDRKDLVAAAIEHFTATEAKFESAGEGFLRVTSIGYWAGPAN